MKMNSDGWLRGLKLLSDEQELLCDVDWCTYRDEGNWVWKDLKDDEQIVGMAVELKTDIQYCTCVWLIGSEKQPKDQILDTSGTWRPALLRPVVFGDETLPVNERSIKKIE